MLVSAHGQVREFLSELRRAFIGLDEGWGDVNEILAIANSWGDTITHKEAMACLRAINEHGSMWEAPEIRLSDLAPVAPYQPRPWDIIRICQAGESMCALLGKDLMEGHAAFAAIAAPYDAAQRQVAGLRALHALLTKTRCGRLPVVWV